MTRLFVYGTLKRGGGNHSFLAGQSFVAPARSEEGHTLYALSGYPGLVLEPGDREGVVGELWLVDDPTLARLDELEGVPVGLYRRAPIRLIGPHEGLAVQTYYYLRSLSGRRRVGAEWPAGGGAPC